MIKFLVLVFTIIQINTTLFAQKELLEEAKLAVDTLFFSDKPLALGISESKISASKVANDTFYITYFLDQAGELNRYLGNLYKAEAQLKECLTYKKNWLDLKDLSLTYNNLGKTYKMQGNGELALENFLEALKLMEIDSNLLGQGYYLNNIGTLFDDQKDHLKAIDYYEKSLKIKEITNDSAGMASTALNMGIAYFKLRNYDSALDRFMFAYHSISYQKSANSRTRAVVNIARTYTKLNKAEKGLRYLKESLLNIENIDDELLKIELYNTTANTYLKINDLDTALFYNNLAKPAAIQTGAAQIIQDVYFSRSAIFENLHQLDSALYFLKQGNFYYDSLSVAANINAVLELEAKYKTERNLRLMQATELEVAQTKEELKAKQVQVMYLAFIILIIIGITVFLIIKYRANKQNSDLLLGQKVLIEQQNLTLNNINSRLREELKTEKFNALQKDEILENVFSKSNTDSLPKELLDLSKRETEVLANLALGLSDDQLSVKLFISKATIKTHLRRIYAKLLVKNRAQAVAIAHKYGIIGNSQDAIQNKVVNN